MNRQAAQYVFHVFHRSKKKTDIHKRLIVPCEVKKHKNSIIDGKECNDASAKKD